MADSNTVQTETSSKHERTAKWKILTIVLFILFAGSATFGFLLYNSCQKSLNSMECPAKLNQPAAESTMNSWERTDYMGAYSFEYPFGWHIASLWSTEALGTITIAINPSPVNTAPRDGPIAEITIIDKSRLQDPQTYLEEIKTDIKDSYENVIEDTITMDFGTVHHYSGTVDLFGEMHATEDYVFMIQGFTGGNVNKHIIHVSPSPFNPELTEKTKHIVESFQVL